MTTCEEVRALLPDHSLGSLGAAEDVVVRGHLRGCGACRRELEALREGVGVFASSLDRPSPEGLRDRVMAVLDEEWTSDGVAGQARPRPDRRWAPLAAAAAIAVALVAGVLGFVQTNRAGDATEDAASYRSVLATLGGTGFRVGRLRPAGDTPVEGSVVAYESSHDQSFVVVFVRTPALTGTGGLLVSRTDGTTWDPGPIEFDEEGDAATWWVTDRTIATMTGLSVRAPDGSLLATASLREA